MDAHEANATTDKMHTKKHKILFMMFFPFIR